MDNEETVIDTPAPAADDRRAAIEQAFEAAESAPDPAPATPTPATSDEGPEGASTPSVDPSAPAPAPTAAPPAAESLVNDAPKAWRAPQRAKWAKLDPDIREEVQRRERELTKVLGDSGTARNIAQQFGQAIAPFQARMQALGQNPFAAVQSLLKADHILSSGSKNQRATLMAQLIKDYDVDILELDNALAGKEPTDPVASRVEQLLAQKLAPFQQYLTQQQQRAQAAEAQSSQQIATTIEQMASDTAKFPHFEALREDMADLVDIASKRGVYLSLEQAYTRASAMNPEISALVTAQKTKEAQRTAAQAAHARAQKALAASSSVGGSPSSTPNGSPAGTDRRAAIEAAFDSIGGR
jgi:hypothetical protein